MSNKPGVFGNIYALNSWGFGSGHGSLPKATRRYRQFLADFMRENKVRSVVDYGCGDWQFSRLVDWSRVNYLGLDVISGLIDTNNKKYRMTNVRFEMAPEQFANVPSADLLIVKDVLQHFPTEMVRRFMEEAVPHFKFALITNCIEPASELNREITLGDFRPLDLRAAPFHYRAPAVFCFSGPKTTSLRTFRTFPAWHKIVLLYHSAPKSN